MFLMGKFGKNLKKVYNMAVQKSQKGADSSQYPSNRSKKWQELYAFFLDEMYE